MKEKLSAIYLWEVVQKCEGTTGHVIVTRQIKNITVQYIIIIFFFFINNNNNNIVNMIWPSKKTGDHGHGSGEREGVWVLCWVLIPVKQELVEQRLYIFFYFSSLLYNEFIYY